MCIWISRYITFLIFLHCLPNCFVNSSKAGSCCFFFPSSNSSLSTQGHFSLSPSRKEEGKQSTSVMIPSETQESWFSASLQLVCGFHCHNCKWPDLPLGIMAMFKAGRRDEEENKGALPVVKILSTWALSISKTSPQILYNDMYIYLIDQNWVSHHSSLQGNLRRWIHLTEHMNTLHLLFNEKGTRGTGYKWALFATLWERFLKL